MTHLSTRTTTSSIRHFTGRLWYIIWSESRSPFSSCSMVEFGGKRSNVEQA